MSAQIGLPAEISSWLLSVRKAEESPFALSVQCGETFPVDYGQAHVSDFNIGQRDEAFIVAIDGHTAGELVIIFPDERIADGSRIVERATKKDTPLKP